MTMLSLYDATVPVFTKALGGVDKWLDMALTHAGSKNFDVQRLLDAWLAPDQYNFTRQIQSACDYAKFGTSKLAGREPPARPDTETTVTELRARLQTEIEYLGTFTRADFVGGEDRACSHTWMSGKVAPRRGLSRSRRAAELSLPPDERVRDPPSQRGRTRKDGLPGRPPVSAVGVLR
jgi:uncharacterized protein